MDWGLAIPGAPAPQDEVRGILQPRCAFPPTPPRSPYILEDRETKRQIPPLGSRKAVRHSIARVPTVGWRSHADGHKTRYGRQARKFQSAITRTFFSASGRPE